MFQTEPSKHTIDAINMLLNSVVTQSVQLLASTYNFNAEEAITALKGAGIVDIPENIVVSQHTPRSVQSRPNKNAKIANLSPNIPLPWCGTAVATWCQALRVNHNLFSQCTNPIDECSDNQSYCTTCWSNYVEKQSFRYGTVKDREAAELACGNTVDFVHNAGSDKAKKALPYANVMTKHSPPITKEQAQEEATRFGLTIPDDQFVPRVLKRGRPSAKVTVTPIRRSFSSNVRDDLSPELIVESPITPARQQTKQSDDNDDSIDVEEFEFENKKYYIGTDNTIYCPETSSAIGRWDKLLKSIVPL
jgi:hypothetical protein